MDREGLTHLSDQFLGTDRLWLLNRLRSVVGRFLAWNPSHEPITRGDRARRAGAAQRVLHPVRPPGGLPGDRCDLLPRPDGHGLHPYQFHELLKADHEHLKGLCDFGIHVDCRNRMDHLLVFPSGSSLVWFAACRECAEELRFWI